MVAFIHGNMGLMAHSNEKVPVVIVEEYDDIARLIAGRLATLIKTKKAAGEHAVLGLATGSTPIGVYRELIRLHRDDEAAQVAQTITGAWKLSSLPSGNANR